MGIPGAKAQPARLGRYELLARLATGGMGEIFLARLEGAEGFEKLYVVKRILPHLADDTRFRQMLIAEARIASKFSHGNICQVYELGETDGQLYIVMEYLEGVTLLPLLRRTARQALPMEPGFVAGVLQQVCDALHYAHELKDKGEPLALVHRDVTPSNIFLTESGVAKVLDFGIAKARGASTNTQEGTVKGKYAYMAPEQLRGGELDRRADLFALGVVAFEMLALRRLFQRKTDYLTFRAVMEQPVPDIRRYRPDVPEAAAFALARALDRDPTRRFDSARQFASVITEAFGARRPWSQGEISDYVRNLFAEDLGTRGAAIAQAVQLATGSQAVPRAIPVIAAPEPDAHDGDDEGFPSVETDVEQLTPFAAESTGNPVRVEPVRVMPAAPAPVVVVAKRSLVWPLLAIAMVGIAGAALYLVYQQSQKPQQPTSVVIQQTRDPLTATPTPTPSPTPVPVPVPVPVVPAPRPAVKQNPYLTAISPHLAALTQCVHAHADGDLPKTATIVIAPTGHATSVSWQPASLDTSPLGGCMKTILLAVPFPHDAKEQTINWSPSLARARG